MGGAAGVISFIFALALLANNNWVSWDAKERPHPVNEASSGSLGPFRSSGGSLHGVSSTFSNSRRAAQAFTLIGFFATLPLLVASIYGGWRQNAAHPWPKVAFLSIAVHCKLFVFLTYNRRGKIMKLMKTSAWYRAVQLLRSDCLWSCQT